MYLLHLCVYHIKIETISALPKTLGSFLLISVQLLSWLGRVFLYLTPLSSCKSLAHFSTGLRAFLKQICKHFLFSGLVGTQTTKSELLSSGRSLRGRAEGLDHPGDTNSIRTRSSWAGRLTFDTRGLEGELRDPCALGQSPWSLLGFTGESYSCLSGGFLHSSSTSPKSDHFLVSEYEGTLNKSCPEYFCLVSVSVVFFFAIAYHYLFIL